MIDICDLELVGNKLVQGDFVINLTKEYYQQQVIEQSDAQELLQRCDIANLVGERIVEQAIHLRLANQASVRKISGVPFLMIYKFQHR